METLSEAQDDSSGANPSSVKSEDGSPPPDGDRGSPPPNCAICLGRCRNKSFTDSCLHQFCFKCLVTWSKVKTECPLCKQNFKSIIHNVQSNQQYEEYRVEQRLHEEDRIDIDDLVTATRRFRYRTTLTFPRGGDHIALQRLLMHYPPLSAMVGMSRDLPGIAPAALPSSRRRRSPSSFRRTVYRHNLWARPLPDFTGRHRDCSPEFYRYNDSQMHRLVPWLNRELHYLLLENAGHIAYVLSRILELLPQYHITSPEFRQDMFRYFANRTDHFLHELHCFASTPYDLTGYDRNVQYTTDSRVSNNVNDVISSSDTESGDSDIMLVPTPSAYRPRSSPQPYRPASPVLPSHFETNPGPSRRAPDPVYPRNHIAPVDLARHNLVIPIETISHSDTDDDEVMVTGYIKPPHQRTPEVVDLRDSDSDVVVTEGPSQPSRALLQLTVSRHRSDTAPAPAAAPASYTPPPPPPPPRMRRRTSSSSYSPSSERDASPASTPSPRRATPSSDESTSESSASPVRRNKRKRTRRSRDASARLAAALLAYSSETPERDPREKNRLKKSKSTDGKGVKSSRRVDATRSSRTELASVQGEPQPGPSSRPDGREGRSSTASTSGPEEPRPGPSSRPVGKVGKSSKRNETTDSRATASMSSQEEPWPGSSSKSSKRNEATDSRATASMSSQEEPWPGSSSKSSRRDEATDSRASAIMSGRQEEPWPGSSSRPAGKVGKTSKKDDNSESRRAGSTMEIQEEPQPRSSSSRSGGKGGKSRNDEAMESQKDKATAEARPSSRAGPSGTSGTSKRKSTDETFARRNSRESKRLKSVVKKTSSWSSTAGLGATDPGSAVRASNSTGRASNSTGRASNSTGRASSASVSSSTKARKRNSSCEASENDASAPLSPDFFTDSDDDIPLNLTIQRSARHS